MSKENVIISLDGHPQAFIDLKPWLAAKHHAAFDEATRAGIEAFKGANGFFAQLAESGYDFEFEDAEELVRVDWRQYNQVLSCEERLAKIDADGVSAELLIDGFGPMPEDPALDHEITLAFCRWFQDYVSPAPHRFTGAVVVSFRSGVDAVVEEIAHAYERGVKAIHLPPAPSVARPDLPNFNHRMYEPIWRALDERGMSMIWHASTGREKPTWRWEGTERGWESLLFLEINHRHASALQYLLLAGVPERYPNLKLGYIEAGSAWIGPLLQELDGYMAAAPKQISEHRLQMKPSEQWARQGYCAGPLNQREIAARHETGIPNLCFGSDFIHTESCYPHSRRHLARLLADVPAAERNAILRDNAVRIFGFDLDKLAETPAAQLPLFPAKSAAAELSPGA